MSVDVDRKRIGLSMRLTDDASNTAEKNGSASSRSRKSDKRTQSKPTVNKPQNTASQPSALALSLKAAMEKD